jgi:hypothetical protein
MVWLHTHVNDDDDDLHTHEYNTNCTQRATFFLSFSQLTWGRHSMSSPSILYLSRLPGGEKCRKKELCQIKPSLYMLLMNC